MAQQPSNSHSGDKPNEMNSATLESMWRQAVLIRDMTRDEIESSRVRRDEAEKARLEAEQESIRATEEMCASIRQQAESELEESHRVLGEVRELEDRAQTNLSEAVSIKEQAEREVAEMLSNASKEASNETRAAQKSRAKGEAEAAATLADAGELMGKARTEAEASSDRIIEEANNNANQILKEANSSATRIKANANTEIERVKADLDAARAAAQQELDTQRALTDMLRDRVAGPELVSEVAVVGKGKAKAKYAATKAKKPRKKAKARKAKSPAKISIEATGNTAPAEVSVNPDTPEIEVATPEASGSSEAAPVASPQPSAIDELKEMLAEGDQAATTSDSTFDVTPETTPESPAIDAHEGGDSSPQNRWVGGRFIGDDEQLDDAQVA